MKKPTRKQALALITAHGFKGELAEAQKIWIENRISWGAYRMAYSAGEWKRKGFIK